MHPATRRRLDIQGFEACDDPLLGRIGPWLRVGPALCGLVAAIGTARGSPWVLGALAATALLGSILPNHPFELIYQHGIRHWIGSPPLPPSPRPRRFACQIATVWLIVTSVLFWDGHAAVGTALGIGFVGVAGLVSLTDICVPSRMYRWIFRRPVTATSGGSRAAAGGRAGSGHLGEAA